MRWPYWQCITATPLRTPKHTVKPIRAFRPLFWPTYCVASAVKFQAHFMPCKKGERKSETLGTIKQNIYAKAQKHKKKGRKEKFKHNNNNKNVLFSTPNTF